MYKNRIQKLRDTIIENGIEGIIIGKRENRFYMSGFSGSEGVAVITSDKAILITDSRYTLQAKDQAKDYEVLLIKNGLSPFETAILILESLRVKNVGIESHAITLKAYDDIKRKFPNIDFIKTGGLVEKIRIVKDSQEINTIRAAQKITDTAFSHILELIKPGVSEKDLAIELEYCMKKNGAQETAFDTIFASGPRSSLPHGAPTDRKLKIGDLITIDFGARYNFYCSDMTRTVLLGKPSEKQLLIYNTVLEAQETAINFIKPGCLGKDVDKIARDIIRQKGFGDFFGHGLGHGVGVEIHEEPRLSPTGNIKLLPGMVITVEPGIYIEDFGGVRIEDMVVVTESGCENLTKSKKELICL